eukprot:TRINITY_DN2388_c0_g1_i2.p1 TRINITY_DN2388_c0_g1~~TRINITY_DN2388_c0_g1_i2.p1  ORF type:complete len:377 (+),score=155.28 TRINITY_DN2388_c0_g1_i2:46-1131(+)
MLRSLVGSEMCIRDSPQAAEEKPAELTTIEKLQARVWLMEDELEFATKVQTRSAVEAREWNGKVLELRNKLHEVMAEHKKWTDHKAKILEPPPLSEKELEQQAMLEKLKRHIAELGEKRQETLEELEAVKEEIERSKSENELERGSRKELVAEQAELEAKIAQVSQEKEEQQKACDQYEAARDEIVQKELARIEHHVMGKLDAIVARRQQQEAQIHAATLEVEVLEREHVSKLKIQEVLEAQLADMQDEIKKKETKMGDYKLSTQGMIENIEKTQVDREEAGPMLEKLVASVPGVEEELQQQVAEARREEILCLEEKIVLLELLGQDAKASHTRQMVDTQKLKLEYCPNFISLNRSAGTAK